MRTHFWIICTVLLLFCAAGCNKPAPSPAPSPTPTPTPTPVPTPPVDVNYFKADIKDLYVFNSGGGSGVEVAYKTDIKDWTVTPSERWCKITVESARFVILVDEYKPTVNPDGSGGDLYTSPRTCTVQLTAGTAFSKTFTVLQESRTIISIPFQPLLLSAAGASADVLVNNNCYSWTATTDASWLTLKKKDSSTLTVTSTARPASESTPRKATVMIVSDLDDFVNARFTVADADSELSGEDYNYGDHTDWD